MAPSFMPLLARVFVPGYNRTVGLVKNYRWLFLSGRNQVCLSPSPELNDGDPSMTDRRLLHPNIVYHYTTFMYTPVVRYNLNSTCILYPGFHHIYQTFSKVNGTSSPTPTPFRRNIVLSRDSLNLFFI